MERECINCGKSPLSRHNIKYCSIKCQVEYQRNQKIQKWLNGQWDGNSGNQLSKMVRNYMLKLRDYKCEKCGWDKINPFTGKVPLEVHHIDGNYKNNTLENLQVICPNCHSLTNTFRSLNNNGRPNRNK